MGRSNKDGRPVAGPATGAKLKAAIRDAIAPPRPQQVKPSPETRRPGDTGSDFANGVRKLTAPKSNIDPEVAAGS